jgi:phosphoribosylanthranilate isomerase
MIRVKLCGVRRPEDALLCAEAGADEVGVVFAPRSKRRVTVEEARAIRAALPSAVPLVGVFQDASLEEALRIAREVGLAALQFHGKLPEPRGDLPLYAAVQVDGTGAGLSIEAMPDLRGFRRVLLDGPAGGSGISFAWSVAKSARGAAAEVFVAGGLTAGNVAEAIRAADPHGVDVASGIEGADGFKDPERVHAFVRAARGAR